MSGWISESTLCAPIWTSAPPALGAHRLRRFHKMLATDELRAWYGPEHVALAVDRGAVGTLLISDDLFRYVDNVNRDPLSQDQIKRSNDPK